MTRKKWEWKKFHSVILLVLMYVVCLAVLSMIGYSDGDDTFFLEYCGSMGFFEYLSWRYETWTGRIISEGLMHIFFNLDLWVWRIVNAVILVALPVSLANLKNKVKGTEDEWSENDSNRNLLVNLIMAIFTYLLLDINAFGYSAIWITGSMNYLWPMVCGIVALCVVAEAAFDEEQGMSARAAGKVPAWKFVAASVCAVIAAMSSEQMGAVLLAFEVVCIGEKLWNRKSLQIGLVLQTVLTLGVYLISALAPGNALRIVSAIEHNMPQFESLTLGERAFMLVQWLVSSFANENVVFLIAIWVIGIFLLATKEGLRSKLYMIAGGVFLAVAVISKCGVSALSNMGLNLAELTGLVEQVPVASHMTGMQWGMLVWWAVAMVFTFFFLREASEGNFLLLLTYLGAVACEVILIFSPTIYSSGERVFFLTGLMLMFIVMVLYEELPKGKMRVGFMSILIVIGGGNLLLQAVELLNMIAG